MVLWLFITTGRLQIILSNALIYVGTIARSRPTFMEGMRKSCLPFFIFPWNAARVLNFLVRHGKSGLCGDRSGQFPKMNKKNLRELVNSAKIMYAMIVE